MTIVAMTDTAVMIVVTNETLAVMIVVIAAVMIAVMTDVNIVVTIAVVTSANMEVVVVVVVVATTEEEEVEAVKEEKKEHHQDANQFLDLATFARSARNQATGWKIVHLIYQTKILYQTCLLILKLLKKEML